jgi:threonine/homoserine/homoserine lactone efflux protein
VAGPFPGPGRRRARRYGARVDALLLGLSIGLAAGISPGPLLVLVVTATLRGGRRAGLLTAAAPLVTDVVVVGVTLLLLGRMPARALAGLGVAGAVFVLWTGIATVREARTVSLSARVADGDRSTSWAALRRGATVNLLSPHPWVSWMTALGPLVVRTWRSGPGSAVLLVAGFYLTLVGAKAVLAAAVAGGSHRLSDTGYRRALTGAGLLLVVVAAALAAEFGPALR